MRRFSATDEDKLDGWSNYDGMSFANSMQTTRLLYIAAISGVFFSGCSDEAATGRTSGQAGERVAKVVTHRVAMQPMVDDIQALGTANANESIEIQPRLSSVVERIRFEEGQAVSKGDILVELENAEIVAGLAVADASLSESRSLYNRSKSLGSTQAISASSLEQLLAQVQVDEALVEAARARLANTIIRAPFSGRIGLRRVSPGGYVSNSTVITTLDDISVIKLDFSVPEAFMSVLKEDMKIVAHSLVYPDRVFRGAVSSIDTRLDPISRAVLVRAIIPNEDEALKPGMFLSVDLQRDRGNVLVAPEQSIVPEGSKQYVYVVADGIATKREVVLGRRVPGLVVIEQGLTAGESVVTEGTHRLNNGARVEEQGPLSADNGSSQDL